MSVTTSRQPNNEDPARSDIVFIISPTTRSGTTYLRHLLVQGGACGEPNGWPYVYEDWLLHGSNHLIDYCNTLEKRWSFLHVPEPHTARQSADDILRLLGGALESRISANCDEKYVVVKTPSSENVQNIASLFPTGRLILLIRDGRDACQSNVRSGFSKNHLKAIRHWAERAQTLLNFDSNVDFATTRGKHLWIRYEDSVVDPVGTLGRVKEFLGLPADSMPLDHLGELPIYGSSEVRDDNDHFVRKVKPKTENFNPIGRWRSWPDEWVNDFKKLAGKQLIQLGYETTDDW